MPAYLPASDEAYDVAACTMCVAAIVNPGMDMPNTLTLVPATMTAFYDPTDNGGWESQRPCETCNRDHMYARHVVTLIPNERTATMPTMPYPSVDDTPDLAWEARHGGLTPDVPEYAMHYETIGVDICTACFMVAANGVLPDDSELSHMPLSKVPEGHHVVPGSRLIGEEEPWFSSVRCDTCEDSMAGTRHAATMMSIERVPCQDCINLVRHQH